MDTEEIRKEILQKLRPHRSRGMFVYELIEDKEMYDIYEEVVLILGAEGLISSKLLQEKGEELYDIRFAAITPKSTLL